MILPTVLHAGDRTLPMHFNLRLQGPGETCGGNCTLLIEASGAITADTPQEFKNFARERDLKGAMVVLDSDGGSVHGAIGLGREIRRIGLDTTVGRLEDLETIKSGLRQARLSPHGDCESMCAFVLAAGVHRTVPSDARVMVHQIWLGDRREDPTAANYSAEDLVLVQRDIGRLAQYTSDMGASIELLDLALRIPPWEPMHTLTIAEMRRTRLETQAPLTATGATVASLPPAPVLTPAAASAPLPSQVTDGARAVAISEQRWSMVDMAGSTVLARRHPLTLEGDGIGSFDLFVGCGTDGDSYSLRYVERRRGNRHVPLPRQVGVVAVAIGGTVAKLKVVSSAMQSQTDELVTSAAATVPAKPIATFAGGGKHSLMVTTRSAGIVTAIRIGNTGADQHLSKLAASCQSSASRQQASGVASVQ
jgi:hypothetical protein